ncbi:MAG TPA: hypothetical protein ENN42_08745 [Thioalkalivibrio sp.]|nr:hypothetical protein [Thioalkalivibrio sp.]
MDTVIARQHPLDPTHLQWRRESSDDSVRLGEGGFAELAQACENARLLWLAPAEDILLTEVNIANRRELRRAAPYALEDELADDIDRLHFAFGKAAANAPVPVAVIGRERLAGWLAVLADHGLRPQAVVPDVLALPLADAHASILLEDGRGLVRTGPARGLAADRDTLDTLLATELEASAAPERLDVWRCAEATGDTPRLGIPVEERRCPNNPLELVPAGWGRQLPLNLLQGEFRPRRPARRHAPWWIAAALAGAWLLLAFVQDVTQLRELDHLKTGYQDAMRQIYFDTFPDARRAPDPRLLMEQRLEALRTDAGGGPSGSLLVLLDAVGAAIPDPNAARIVSLRFRDGRLDVELDAASAAMLEEIKQTVETGGLRASLQSVDTQGNRVTGRINVERAR